MIPPARSRWRVGPSELGELERVAGPACFVLQDESIPSSASERKRFATSAFWGYLRRDCDKIDWSVVHGDWQSPCLRLRSAHLFLVAMSRGDGISNAYPWLAGYCSPQRTRAEDRHSPVALLLPTIDTECISENCSFQPLSLQEETAQRIPESCIFFSKASRKACGGIPIHHPTGSPCSEEW